MFLHTSAKTLSRSITTSLDGIVIFMVTASNDFHTSNYLRCQKNMIHPANHLSAPKTAPTAVQHSNTFGFIQAFLRIQESKQTQLNKYYGPPGILLCKYGSNAGSAFCNKYLLQCLWKVIQYILSVFFTCYAKLPLQKHTSSEDQLA